MRRLRVLIAVALIAALCGGIMAAANDPLISLSYLTGLFSQEADRRVDEKLDQAGQQQLDAALKQAEEAAAAAEAVAGANFAQMLTEASLKEGDSLVGPTGLVCVPLSGSVEVRYSGGTVVDATAGREVDSGELLLANHKYIAAEDTSAKFTVISPTAVIKYEGHYAFSYSDKTDYVAIADALKLLNLFQGSNTGYGKGYNLEKAPTRLEALVMFIRVMGEEQEALAYTGKHQFTDVRWGDSYVAYAVDKGYTNGVSATRFGADNPASSVMFMEFLLRAMEYSRVGVDNWETSLERAQLLGCITRGEYALLKNQPFTRAQVSYLSYYSLQTYLPQGYTLGTRLISDGVFDYSRLYSAQALVKSERIQ